MTVELHDRHERLLRKYGLTQEQWDKLYEACKGHCGICTKPFSSNRLACVDHDHASGLVRGLVCTDCNSELGYHHDNAGWFLRAASHLTNPPSLIVIGAVYVPGSVGEARLNGYG